MPIFYKILWHRQWPNLIEFQNVSACANLSFGMCIEFSSIFKNEGIPIAAATPSSIEFFRKFLLLILSSLT